jgi:hypothetical protein
MAKLDKFVKFVKSSAQRVWPEQLLYRQDEFLAGLAQPCGYCAGRASYPRDLWRDCRDRYDIRENEIAPMRVHTCASERGIECYPLLLF